MDSKRKLQDDKEYDSIGDEDLEIEDKDSSRVAKKSKSVKKVVILTAAEVEEKCKKVEEAQIKMELKRLVLEARVMGLKAQKLRSDADLYRLKTCSGKP